jgi:hypothetical protein
VRPGGRCGVGTGRNSRSNRSRRARADRACTVSARARARGPTGPRPVLGECAPRRTAGHVQQSARRVHAGGIEHLLPARPLPPATAGRLAVSALWSRPVSALWSRPVSALRSRPAPALGTLPVSARSALPVPAWGTLPVPVRSGLTITALARRPARSARCLRPWTAASRPTRPSSPRPACHARPEASICPGKPGRPALPAPVPWPGDTAPQQHENGENDHAEREPEDGYVRSDTDKVLFRALAYRLQRYAHDNKEQAGHECHGSRDRQGDDYPHPPGGACFGAHCSTIAPR